MKTAALQSRENPGVPVQHRWHRNVSRGARLSLALTFGIYANGYACPIASMRVSASPGPYSCLSMNIIKAHPVPVISSEDCPAGTTDSGNAGALGSCQKTVDGRNETVLKAGERCPIGEIRYIDLDGDTACKHPPKKPSDDTALSDF